MASESLRMRNGHTDQEGPLLSGGRAVGVVDEEEPKEHDPPSFFQRRIVKPFKDVLSQGLSPEALALSLAFGITGGVFPIPGITTLVCAVFIYFWKLNVAACQLANFLMTPIDLMMVIPFIRLGEMLFLVPEPLPLSAEELTTRLRQDPFLHTLSTLGSSLLRAIVAWAVVAAIMTWVLSKVLTPILRRFVPPAGSSQSAIHHAL
ncbi:hypothetical protein QOT17_015008 [Balamuthia mandrillaris]